MLLAATLSCSCGAPGETEVVTIDDSVVPYRLLDADPASEGAGVAGPVVGPEPAVFWSRDDVLVRSALTVTCSDPSEVVVRSVLDALSAGPSEDERAAGRSTSLPPESSLSLVDLSGGVAVVELQTETGVSADRLPAAVGQIALSVASAPGVGSFVLVADGEPVPVPLPGGALTTSPVGYDDYSGLLPSAARRAALGCRD